MEMELFICALIDDRTRGLINEFSRCNQSEVSFCEKYPEDSLLCLPRLRQIIGTDINTDLISELLLHHQKTLSELNSKLKSFIPWRYSEAIQEEKLTPLQIVRFMAGSHGTQ